MTTASASLNYGTMERPAEKKKIETAMSPVEIAAAAYQAWLPVAARVWRHSKNAPANENAVRMLCDEAGALLAPYGHAFAKLSQIEVNSMLQITSDTPEYAGPFLTALLNNTELQILRGKFNTGDLGYRLKGGKAIIVEPGSNVDVLGTKAEGYIINNCDLVAYFATEAVGGAQLNFGKTVNFAMHASGGLQGNFGYTKSLFAPQASGGIQFNAAYADLMAYKAAGGLQIALGKPESSIGATLANESEGGIQLNASRRRLLTLASVANGGAQINLTRVTFLGKGARKGLRLNLGHAEYVTGGYIEAPSLKRTFNRAIAQFIGFSRYSKPYKKRLPEVERILEPFRNSKIEPLKLITETNWNALEAAVQALWQETGNSFPLNTNLNIPADLPKMYADLENLLTKNNGGQA